VLRIEVEACARPTSGSPQRQSAPFSIEYFQHAHGLDLAAAGAINARVFLAAFYP
jgi:hypothetical protein